MSRYADRSRELGAFLRERRSRMSPASAGLPEELPRRTPGLRREEVAALAGLSVGYYVRLEQGHAPHPSESVLAALARTFRLTDDESRHLRALAGHGDHGSRHRRALAGHGDSVRAEPAAGARLGHGGVQVAERASPSALRLLDLFVPPTAVIVLGRIGDVLAWNEAAVSLFPGRLPAPGEKAGPAANNARYVFLSESARELFVDWPAVADDTVAHLRSAAGHLVDDPDLTALVAELSAASTEFASRWARRDVRERAHGDKLLNHPTRGHLTIGYDVTALLDTPNQWLVVYTVGEERHEQL